MNVNDRSMESRLDFLKKVHQLCETYFLSVTCWVRTPKRNKLKGGLPNSWHVSGFAVDVVPDTWPAIPSGLLINIKAVGLHYLVEDDHIHIQAFPGKKKL